MGYGSTAVNHFVGRPSIAADLCNGAVFVGRQILKAADLKPWKSETEFVITDKENKKQQVHRFRDAIF